MVFESIVVSILNKYIGKYVKNLDSKNLSIGLWSGEATLCDLELREEALLEYDLPVEVNSGYIGKLSLNIPWSSIYVNPVVVRIEDVYVLTGPQAEKPYNEEKERKYLNIIKQKQLHTIVKGEKRSREQVVSSVKDTNDTLTEKLTAQIIKNVQVFITSIHLRYEDKITNPSHPFTFGVTLHSISAQTTDANWLPAVIDGSTKNNFKLLRMESLSFYWNPKDMSLLNGLPNWKSLMRSQISQWASIELSQEFILRPLSLTIKAIVDQDAKVLMKFPKFVLNIILKDLSLELSKLQVALIRKYNLCVPYEGNEVYNFLNPFEGIINLVESFEMMSINQQYRKYKPSEGVKENPMKWWKYAYTSIVETSYRPWTWARIKEHRVEYKKYVALYRQMLKFEYLDEKKSLNVIRSKIKKEEDELNAANILIARKQAQNEFDNAKKAGIEATPEKETVGWLEWLGITGNLTENQEEELDMSAGETFSLAALSAEQKDELYRAIGYVNDTTHPVYLKTYIRSKLSLHLDNCSVTLKDTQTRKIATFSMIKLVSELSERPGSEGYGFKLEVENMGVFSEVGVQDVDILKTKTIAENFLALNFQINPTERTADYSVDLVIQPMHVMYNKQFADAIRHFFVIQNKELEQNASSKLDEISYASRAGIEYSIMSNKSTYLHVNLKSPVVILPHQGICDRTNEELYLYLGDLTVATDLRTLLTEQAISEATESDLEQMFYHKTDVKLSDIHVGCGFFDNEKKQIEDSCCDNYILPPSQVEVTVYRSLKSGYANFPDFKISGILPSFEVKLTEKKVIQIVEVVNYFLPAATPSSTHNKSHSQSSQSKRKLSGSVMSKSDLSNLQDILNQSTKPRKRKLNVFSNETTSLDVEIDVPDSLQSYDSNLSMYDRTKLLASFEIMKISICYAVMIDSKVTKFLNLVIKNISSNIEMHMWDIKIKAKLQFFTLTDYINKDLNNDPVEIIVSTDHTDLIHVEWKQADVSGPEFTTTFQQTENFVNIKFGVLKFHLREQALMLFLNSFQSLSHRVSMILDQTVPVPTTSQLLDVIAEDDKVDIESKESLHKLEEAVMVSTSLHINFVLSTINFSIADISQDVAYGDISDIKLSIIVRSCAVEIFAQLKSFEVFDATLDVMCKKIVSVNADKVLKCNITQYHDISKDNLDPDMTIDLNLGKLRLNIVQRFIVNLLRMFQSISSSLITQESTAAHIPVVQDRDTAGEIFKLKLDVVIDAPDIALPVSKCDDQYFLLDLGHCEIHSELIEKNNKISDKITFSLQELKLLRIDMDKQRQNISPISLEIVLIRSLNDIIPMFEIDCKLPVLAMKLHKQDIMSFMTCLHGIIEDIGGLLQDTSSDVKEVIKSPKCTEQQQPTQIINAVVNIHQVALQAFSEEAKEEILFLNLTAETVTLTYQQQTTILAVEVSLGFLSLIDLKTKDAFDNPVTLFTSIDGQELASMSYSSDTSSNCQSISVELNQVTINANDESVTSLVDYLKDFSESVNAVFDKDEKQSEEMSVVSEHEQALSKFDVHCKLNTLSFYWHTKKNIFAKSQVDGLTLLLDKTGNNVGVKTRLKNLYMEDLRNNALYSKIIVLEDQDLLSLEFSLKEHTSLSIGNDMCGAQVAYVWLRVGKIKVVLLYKFIMEIMNCVNPFLLSLSGNNDGKSLHDDKHELTSPNEESKMLLFHLDIDVTAPVILIPKLSTSTTHLVLDLGKCIVTNSVETDGSPEGAETENEITIDHVKASLSSVKLIIMNLRDEKEKRVSKDISASVHIYRPLNPSANKITVNIDVLPVIVLLSDVDIQLLMNIVQLNLGEADNSVTANGNVIGKTSIIEADVHRDCGDVSSGTTRKEHNGATLATEIDDCESEFVTENEETPAIKIEIHCELIELHLSSVLLFQDCSEEQNINICRLSASSASVKIFKTDDLIDLHLTIFQLTGDDQRPFSIATFKRILEKQTNHNECSVPDMSVISASTFFKQHGRNDNHITVTYTAKNDKQAVALIIADARTFVNLEFINDLISYLSNIFTGDFINYIDHTTSDESTVKQNITPISEERASAKLSVTCQLENGEVILLENPNKNSTTAIVSRIQLNLKYVADQSATIIKIPMCVVEILFGEYPVLRRTARPLLQPCQLECEINMPDSATKDISINVQVMKFKLSPSILTTIIKITENLTSSQLLQEEEITSCKQTSYVDWTSHPLSDDKINRKDSIHTNSVVVETKIAGKEKAKLSFAMIEVILGNDLEGMFNPLLTAKISTRANILDWSALMRIDADFTTEVFYFNELVGTWEPFIEPSINAASCQPYEVNARMFYGESKQMDFSSNDLCKEDDDGLFADEIDATGDEKKGDALIVIISSEDVLQLTVTQKAIEMLTYVTQVLSLKSLGDNVKTKLLLPFHFESQLGLPVVICMEPSVKASTTNDSHLEFQPRLPLVDAQQVTQKVSFSDQPGKSLKRRKERNYSLSSGKAIPSIDVSDSNPWLVGELSQTDCIDIEVHGYLPVKNISLKEAGNQIYALLPHKDGNLFQLVVQVKIVTGSRIVILGSSIQIVNNLKLPIEIFTENTIGSAVSILEVNGGTKTCLSLQHSLLTEFMVKNKRFSFDEPIGLKGDDQVIKGCTVDQSNRCYIKVRKIATDQKYQKSVPIHTIEFLPVVQITSYLPVNVQMQLKNDKEQSQYHSVNSGETLDVLDMNLKDDFTVSMRYINEKGNEWIGTGKCGKHKKESTAVFLKNNATADIRFEIGLEKRSHSIQLLIYSVFWVVNKTGLDLNFKVDSREYILNSSKEHEPRLISYANVKKTKGRLCVGDSTWSEAFSLSAVGDESFVTCKSDDGSYAVYISIQLSHTGLTNIISLSARYLISNHTSLDLMFAEVLHQSIDVEELSWIPLPIMQCSPVWLHSPTASILLKEKDSAFVGAPIPFNCDNKLAKRLSNSQTVCVDVNHLGDEFIMNVTSYEEGCIPLRVDNYCNSSIFLQQRDVESLAAVTEYLPKSTQYFNWLEFDKAHQIVVMLLHPNSRKRNVNISLTGWGRMIMPENSDVDGVDKGEKKSCFGCPSSCFPSLCKKAHNEEDAQHLLSPISASSPSSELVYWVSYLEGMQRVLAFTMDFSVARILRYSGDLEDVTTEVFLSLQGVGMSLINSVPKEICYAAFTGGTSVWEVETKENIWKTLDIDTSTYLEDSWKNSVFNARFENKIAVDLKAMMMTKPYRGKIKRSCDPAVWVQYSQSKNNASFYLTMHRLQVDSQQYDVIYPSVLYPAPLPPRVLKRNGLKPLLEFFIVFSSSHDVMIIKYLKVLLQEVNLKIDRSIVNGIMSLVYNANTESSGLATFEHDIEDVKESVEKSFRAILESKSSKLLINYFHLSPVKIHLSFSMDDETSTSSTSNEELLQWFISTIGIQFTDISDAVIKLGYFERKNTSITKDLLLADATKHYALQAVKQFHVLVLGLDVLGNPYGLISEYRQGVKDLFYEPYLGSVAGPHQFAKGLAYGIKSLLGHTIGGTAGAASLITEQLGQVVAAMSFDSEYKRRRRREMSADPSGVGQGLAIGGKQFILGLMFGISGLVTQPVKGARKGGIEGFFKGVGKGILGLLVKPTGGVIDLVTSSLDGVRRFAEQGGEDIVVRARLPRVTYPGKPVTVYNSEKSYGCGLLRSLRAKQNIEGEYMDHLAIPNDEPTIVIFTSDMVIEATQSRFFSEWKVEWSTYYKLIKNIEMVEETVRFIVKFSSVAKESVSISHATYHEVLCSKMAVAKMLQEKALTCWKASEKR